MRYCEEFVYNGIVLRLIDYPNIRKGVYYIDNAGTIVYSKIRKNDKILNAKIDKDGYLKILLQAEYSDKSIGVHIHRLVMFTYGTKPPSNLVDPVIDHIDMDKTNNCIHNLRWVERSFNSSIANQNNHGENNSNCSITEETAKRIVQDLIEGSLNCKEIAKLYNVSYDIVTSIKRKTSWRHLTHNINFNMRHKSKPVTDEVRVKIANDIIVGKYTDAEIAERYETTIDIVRNIRNKRSKGDKDLLKDFDFCIVDYNRKDKQLLDAIKHDMVNTNIRNCELIAKYDVDKRTVENLRSWLKQNPNKAKEYTDEAAPVQNVMIPVKSDSEYVENGCVGLDPFYIQNLPLYFGDNSHNRNEDCKQYVFDPNSVGATPFDK